MKERDPQHTFAKNTFGRFVKKHGIELEIAPVDLERMDVGPLVRKTNIFVASLTKKEKVYTRTIEFDRTFDYMPEAEDVLEYIANEVAAYRYYKKEPVRCALTFGYNPQDPRFLAFMEALVPEVEAVKLFLGDEAYREFVTITEVRGPYVEPV